MPRIQANRDAIDDRFSVLGFTVRSESPLFEIGVATDPALFQADHKAARCGWRRSCGGCVRPCGRPGTVPGRWRRRSRTAGFRCGRRSPAR